MARWTHLDSETLYNVPKWGLGFFQINEQGNVEVKPEGPDRPQRPGIDMYELLGQILRRGVSTPILMRFDGILRARVRQMNEAFDNARREFNYEAPYRGVFPIKVNQERHVVEALLSEGANYKMGLEVGSKPELIAVDRAAGGPRLADDLQRVQGRGVHRDGVALDEARHRADHRDREVVRARYRDQGQQAARHPSGGRRAHEALRSRRGSLAGFGRRPLEVRPDDARDRASRRGARAREHARLPAAAALPPRQPDPRDPLAQERAARSDAHARRPAQDGRADQVVRRRRRPRRRLRRLARRTSNRR